MSKWARLSGIGIQMAVVIFLSAYFGKKLDAYYQLDKNWFTLVFVLLGFLKNVTRP